MTTPFSTLRCIHCRRPLWDGGHALNKDECSEQGGEVCLLHKEIHRLKSLLQTQRRGDGENSAAT